MKYRIILLTLLIASMSFGIQAQGTVERAKKRTERKANSRVDRKIDNEVDKAFNAIEGLFKKKKKKEAEPEETTSDEPTDEETQAASAIMGMLTGGDQDFEPFENEHEFTLLMTVTEEKRNKTDETSIRLGATTTKIAMIAEGEGSNHAHMIFDTEDGKTTMINTDNKGRRQGYRMRMPNIGKVMDDVQEDISDNYKFERTGERRTINGYDCELIIVEDTRQNTTTRSWITNDLELSSQDVFGTFSRMMGGKGMPNQAGIGMAVSPEIAEMMEGFPIQSTTIDGNKTYTMEISDIKTDGNIDRSLFDVGDVEIQEMGF